VATIAVVALSGCGPKSDVVTLKMAHGLAVTHPVHKAMEFMAAKALEKSDSTLAVEIYPNEQLGNEKECIEKLQLGAIALTKVSSSMLESFLDEYKVYALPYIFRDAAHRWKVLNGPVGKKILASGESIKLKGLVYYDAGSRSFYTTQKPILHPDDLTGLKIRTQQSPMAMKMIAVLGGSATPISWGELYTSLQQGVVDGAENNEPSLYTSNHYEVCKHYSLDEHTCVPDVVLINTLTWNKLSDRHQQALQEAAEESVTYQRELWNAFVKESMDKMVAAGLQVYQPDKTPFEDRAQKMWKEFEGNIIGELAKEIQQVQ
jgi:tripartite ATP-independent transporter DctP family solute receptor